MPPDEPSAARASSEPITGLIAERVRTLREAAGWTQAQLADEVAKHGPPWKRATVVNLEKRAAGSRAAGGGRDAITVQELLALALALDVPPITLLADPRNSEPVPVSTQESLDPWIALLWLAGVIAIDSKPLLRNFRRESWLLLAGLDVNEAAGVLVSRAPSEDDIRRALEKLSLALERIDAAGAKMPSLDDRVLERAAEYGVELRLPEA